MDPVRATHVVAATGPRRPRFTGITPYRGGAWLQISHGALLLAAVASRWCAGGRLRGAVQRDDREGTVTGQGGKTPPFPVGGRPGGAGRSEDVY
jgi:hypothetical protein